MTLSPVCSYTQNVMVKTSKSEVSAAYRCRMPMEDSLCLMRPTLPSLFLLCWMDTLQICTTTSHSSLAVRRLSLGPGSSLHVEASSWPSYQKETEGMNWTRENHSGPELFKHHRASGGSIITDSLCRPTELCFELSWRSQCLQIGPTELEEWAAQ